MSNGQSSVVAAITGASVVAAVTGASVEAAITGASVVAAVTWTDSPHNLQIVIHPS